MNTLDILILGINSLLIVVIYQSLVRFWQYRIRKKLIEEGFINEENLAKIFHWDKRRSEFELVRSGLTSSSVGGGLLACHFLQLISEYNFFLLGLLLLLVGIGCGITLIILKVFYADK